MIPATVHRDGPGATVERWNPHKDGALSEAALRRKLAILGYEVRRYVYPPSTDFPPHKHGVEKMDGGVAGQFRIRMASEEVVLGPGDAIRVPRGAEHRAQVVGKEAVVSLDAIKR
ncbi:MAG TPA: cupin domain-containing protein [Terriglobales bacterium]|nr:cupin domain-containing protein [Terriglobales bacterium]